MSGNVNIEELTQKGIGRQAEQLMQGIPNATRLLRSDNGRQFEMRCSVLMEKCALVVAKLQQSFLPSIISTVMGVKNAKC